MQDHTSPSVSTPPAQEASPSIWWLAFGYFACYVPYTALVKALSSGALETDLPRALTGTQLLPISILSSVAGMYGSITLLGWWKYASRRTVLGLNFPFPAPLLCLSGLCTAAIAVTTTLAYTFDGVSIVFVMLLMRGGVLILAPVVDVLTGRRVRWFSQVGLGLSLLALLKALSDTSSYAISLVCAIDVAVYLLAYFVRLRLMTRLAKSDHAGAGRRFFVEEQMVATPAVAMILAMLSLTDTGKIGEDLRFGFTELWDSSALLPVVLVGILSQGTGVFGGLVLLDTRENTFCVPVNRSSSILAGMAATFLLMLWLGSPPPPTSELVGAGLILIAILFLSIPPLLEKRRASKGRQG